MVRLTDQQQAMLDGAEGEGVALAMRIVTGLARVGGAAELVEVSGAHVDSCLYHGRAGLDFARRLVELGVRVRIPTTLNVGSVDQLHPGTVRADSAYPDVLTAGRELMDAYAALGASPTFTCAPYQVGARPGLGEHVAWAESNAIVFCNSVLGARTDRYGDFLDICAAVTGLAPRAGFHLDERRRAQLVLDVGAVPPDWWADTSWWAVLGVVAGDLAQEAVPAIVGLPMLGTPASDRPTETGPASGNGSSAASRLRLTPATEDALKALGAAAASSGAIGMFHAVGLTPEAPTLDAVADPGLPVVTITAEMLRRHRNRLCTSGPGRVEVDSVCVGTPHASVTEWRRLAELLARDGRCVAPGVQAVVSTSRGVLALAGDEAAAVRAAGWQVVVDTCTYVTPILRAGTRTVVTNSGKWAHYAPANLGVDVVLAELAECVAAAATGWVDVDG